jgi:omega-6 fatty acid desaturase (delta-12 desaturase)
MAAAEDGVEARTVPPPVTACSSIASLPSEDLSAESRQRPARSDAARQAVSAFAGPIRHDGLVQLLTSFGPFIAACAAMHLVFSISAWLVLALAVPTGALLVRVFIVQHDCGHGSFFASRRANAVTGRLCSLVTLTPFANWARQHGLHHGNWSNLERREGSDLYSACLTVREYLALSPWQRWRHRLPRHPLVANLLLPPLVFLVLYRVPFDTPRHWRRERLSVHLTNAALVALFGTLALLLGWRQVLTVHVSVMVVASIIGVWLFSVQHRFDTARWLRGGDWDPAIASMEASSWLRLPRALHWLTGNIGFHHVHHLNPRVPSYRLASAHDAVQPVWPAKPLSVQQGLRAPRLALWDEARGRLVSFREAAMRGA